MSRNSDYRVDEVLKRIEILTIFRALLKDKVVGKLLDFLNSDAEKTRGLYCDFVAELYKNGGDLGVHLQSLLFGLQSPNVKYAIDNRRLPEYMQQSLSYDLETLRQISLLQPQWLCVLAGDRGTMPSWRNTALDFQQNYTEYIKNIHKQGFGVYAQHKAFRVSASGKILAVNIPDAQEIGDLVGYDIQRKQVEDNTKALLSGVAAQNVLLYGDAGTGKSSTVKALLNKYAKEGLRLVEIQKNQLCYLANVIEELAENPLKFILFIDDLSFAATDSAFTDLKAVLEGSVASSPKNIVVYATSNRRRMMQQKLSDRQGDDLHISDTLQEQASLSERFGLTITFLKPDKDLYSEIVLHYAKKYKIVMPQDVLLQAAEMFALRQGGRSPRTAQQFSKIVLAQQSVSEEK